MGLESFIDATRELLATNNYIYATLVLVIFIILAKLFVKILEKIFLRLAKKTKTTVDDEIITAIQNPISILILLVGLKIFFTELWSAYSFEKYINFTLESMIIVVFIVTIVRVVNIIIQGWGLVWAKRTKSHLDDQLLKLLHQVATVIVYVLGFLWVLAVWGVAITPLLAGLGIGGLAIAFALQPTLANIFGGISLILDKAIKVGDIVRLDSGESGKIYDVGLRSTRIKTWKNEILIVPNSKLVNSSVTNYNQPDQTIRVEIDFSVAYGSNIDKVKKLAMNCLKGEKSILKEPGPFCWFMKMADSGLEYTLKFYIDDISNRWPTQQSVITKLYNGLNKAKISIPFPQREVWVHNMKGSGSKKRKK